MNTLKDILKKGEQKLYNSNIKEYKQNAWIIFSDVFKIDKNYYFLNYNKYGNKISEAKFFNYIEERINNKPVQYILKKQEFMGYNFIVNESVLIPRQETELLVEEVLKNNYHSCKILDLCTGSGCIGISLKLKNKKFKVDISDISSKALDVAIKNIKKYNLNINVIKGDLFENIKDKYDVIISNPPYIPFDSIKYLDSCIKDNEPILSLNGGIDGLDFYRKFADKSYKYLTKNGKLYLEIGYNQGEFIKNIFKKNKVYKNFKVINDYRGLNRIFITNI